MPIVPSAGSIGLGDAEVYKGALDCSSNPNYPAANAGEYYRCSVAGKVGGASGTSVKAGWKILCNTDNTTTGNEATKGAFWDIYPEASTPDVTYIAYDLACQVTGKPDADAVLLNFKAVRAFTLAASGHQSSALVAATAQADFLVKVNGTTKATLRFAAAGTTISIVGGTAAAIAIGDIITIVAPAQDATLSDLSFSLAGTLL